MKERLLEAIQGAYGESSYRLNKKARAVIDEMCFLATDRGYFYAGGVYFMKKFDVGMKTIHNILKKMREARQGYPVYPPGMKHNGRKGRVHLSTNNPYFTYWNDLLGKDYKIENVGTPYESIGGEVKKVPTYSSSEKYIKDHIMYIPKVIKGGPKLINQTFSDLFKESLRTLYLRLRIIYQKIVQ
ncbi:hypothetical protein [Priestia endophytica]|uniref:hypothetical protein n=1 Tax=Priestia endophytica TaxID=135735 RepID=UPI00203B0538|nr:hypothetical protein [Priestia endophytica]MCM3541123.1 hypothetical protein [Priestia endophytica]